MTPKACVSQRKAAQTHAQGVCLSGHLVRITFALFSCRSEESHIGRTKEILSMIPKYPCNLQSYLADSLLSGFLEADCNRASKRRLIAPREKKAWQQPPLSPHCWLSASSERLPERHPSSPANLHSHQEAPAGRQHAQIQTSAYTSKRGTTAADRCLVLFPPTFSKYV